MTEFLREFALKINVGYYSFNWAPRSRNRSFIILDLEKPVRDL